MKSFLSLMISALFFVQSALAAPNPAFQNIKPVLNIDQGQTQKTKFKNFVESLPDFVRKLPAMENFLKHRGDDLVTLSRSDYSSQGKMFSRILISVSGQSLTVEFPAEADVMHGDAVVQIGKAKFRIGDLGNVDHMMKVWSKQDPEFLGRVALNETFRFMEPTIWKNLKPETRVNVMIHLRGMAPQIESILKSANKGKTKKTAEYFHSFLFEQAYAKSEGGADRKSSTSVCTAGGFAGTYQTSGFCGIPRETVKFECGEGQSPCSPLFYRKAGGISGLCVDVPHPQTDNVAALCDVSPQGMKITNADEAVSFVRAYLRYENQTTSGFSAALPQLQGEEKAKLEAYKSSLDAALQVCHVAHDILSQQNCTQLQARMTWLQQAISGDTRDLLTRSEDWVSRQYKDGKEAAGNFVEKHPFWTAGIAAAALVALTVGLYYVFKPDDKKPAPVQSAAPAVAPNTASTCVPVSTCCIVNGNYVVYSDGCCGGGTAAGTNISSCSGSASANTNVVTNTNGTGTDEILTTGTTSRKAKDAPVIIQQKTSGKK